MRTGKKKKTERKEENEQKIRDLLKLNMYYSSLQHVAFREFLNASEWTRWCGAPQLSVTIFPIFPISGLLNMLSSLRYIYLKYYVEVH
jgi:hypothetical protein